MKENSNEKHTCKCGGSCSHVDPQSVRVTEDNVNEVVDDIISWIQEIFNPLGYSSKAVIGISGGKDSSVAAGLCVKALGKERVVGVLMPKGVQHDIDKSHLLCQILDIDFHIIDIFEACKSIKHAVKCTLDDHWSSQSSINLPARMRMVSLYALAQSLSVQTRIVNTCNLSEDWVGYSTRYGDGAGDFSPLANLTVGEVKLIGRTLGLPDELVDKVPTDGLCGKTDEDNLGFTYDVLDRYIRTGECDNDTIKRKIDEMHTKNLFKLQSMPNYKLKLNYSK